MAMSSVVSDPLFDPLNLDRLIAQAEYWQERHKAEDRKALIMADILPIIEMTKKAKRKPTPKTFLEQVSMAVMPREWRNMDIEAIAEIVYENLVWCDFVRKEGYSRYHYLG